MSMGGDPMSLFLTLSGASESHGASQSHGTSKGCSRKNKASCTKPKSNPDPPKNAPKSDSADPWEGETPPKNEIPGTCSKTVSSRLLLRQSRAVCKTEPDVEAAGYSYLDQHQAHGDIYVADTWSIRGPDKNDASQTVDIAVVGVEKDAGRMTVDAAFNDANDSIKKLKLRDMLAGVWKAKGGGGVETINEIVHKAVVERGWAGIFEGGDRGKRGEVLDLLGKKAGDEYTLSVDATGVEKQAFDKILRETSQGAGLVKMLEEYGGGTGRQIRQISITKGVENFDGSSLDDMHFTIGEGATA